MKNIEEFLRKTADCTLRKCYRRLGDMNLAEEAFIETYVAVNKNPVSSIPFLRKIVLNIEIERNCKL